MALAMLIALPVILGAQQSDQYIVLNDSVGKELTTKLNEQERGDFDRLQSFLRQKEAEERFVLSRLDRISAQLPAARDSHALTQEMVDYYDQELKRAPEAAEIADYWTRGYQAPLVRMRTRQSAELLLNDLRKEATRDAQAVAALERSKLQAVGSLQNIRADMAECQFTINHELDRGSRDQQFRLIMSVAFAILVAGLIYAFFSTLQKGDHSVAAAVLLGDGGLQFVTLFVLIIAVILFGILGVLEGRELAAILSGIAGYILGRGTNGREKSPTDRPVAGEREVPVAKIGVGADGNLHPVVNGERTVTPAGDGVTREKAEDNG